MCKSKMSIDRTKTANKAGTLELLGTGKFHSETRKHIQQQQTFSRKLPKPESILNKEKFFSKKLLSGAGKRREQIRSVIQKASGSVKLFYPNSEQGIFDTGIMDSEGFELGQSRVNPNFTPNYSQYPNFLPYSLLKSLIHGFD